MDLEIDLQLATHEPGIPEAERIEAWARAALAGLAAAELTVRVVSREESAELNERYRTRVGPTNVLAFASDLPPEVASPYLGDIVICAPLVAEEAAAQGKDVTAHWAHLVVHGILHLRGYGHDGDAEAEQMESLETRVLGALGYADPYA